MANSNPKKKPWFKKANVPKINTQNKEVYSFQITPQHGYYGFKLYFIEEESIDTKYILKNTKIFEAYIQNNTDNFPLKKIEEQKAFIVDLNVLKADASFLSQWINFGEEVISKTEQCLSCMGLAMHQTLANELKEKYKNDEMAHIAELPTIRARLINNEPILQLKYLKVGCYGKLVTIRGTVIKASNVKLLCQYMAFSCSYCGGTQATKQTDGVYTLPMNCPSKGCRAHSNFVPLLSSPYTKTINCQTLKLQELVGDDQYENGRVPRTIECELTEDLVNCCVPGDDITITGVIKVRNTTETNKSKQASVFLLYMDTISIVNEKNQTQNGVGSTTRITFNTKDYYAIKQIHSETMLFRLLVQSLCPTIFGHEIVKAGLLLALFGGTQNEVGIRSDSHVLVVGDPGLGKSQMLQACTNAAPRGVYVCGNTSTSSGLTVTMTRESGGEYALEAGALVLADQGCCCIDEFDKMPSQHACLLEAMEQQSISIAKAGVMCNLPTRVTILAAANPSGGHYNRAKTVSENLRIGSPMLSRFDLVFILLDNPDEHHDMLLSEHVIALHTRYSQKSLYASQPLGSTCSVGGSPKQCISLKDRLKVHAGETVEFLPHSMLRKYIAYAQKYVHPQLNEGAKQVLKKFYLDLRKQYQRADSTPITTRQLESLIRLTQARAKLELREEATAEDAIDVVEIMRHSLVDIFIDELGSMDFTRSQNGVGMSGKKQGSRFLNLLQQKSEAQSKSIFNVKELRELAEQIGLGKDKFYSVLQTFNIQGYLLKKGGDNYQLATSQFC